MGRPPVEWPIPAYIAELRERVVVAFRVPGRALAGRVPAPVTPELAAGKALVCLSLANGRCVRPVGGAATLASEFRTAELFTPARWQAACRAPLRGNMLLASRTDSRSLARMLRTAVRLPAGVGTHAQGLEGRDYTCRLADPTGAGVLVRLARGMEEQPWPGGSLFTSAEAAEIALVHPEFHFVADPGGRVVQAVPVHEYARKTTHVEVAALEAPLVAAWLGLAPEELELDHALFQKRCTHTWSFPPERISVAAPAPTAQWRRAEREYAQRMAA